MLPLTSLLRLSVLGWWLFGKATTIWFWRYLQIMPPHYSGVSSSTSLLYTGMDGKGTAPELDRGWGGMHNAGSIGWHSTLVLRRCSGRLRRVVTALTLLLRRLLLLRR